MAKLFQRILVPYDFSEHSRHALEVACDLAADNGGKLGFFLALPPAFFFGFLVRGLWVVRRAENPRLHELTRAEPDAQSFDISPDGKSVTQYKLPDPMVTNVCFGGKDLRTAYATLSMTGKLVSFEWPRPGLKLEYLNK